MDVYDQGNNGAWDVMEKLKNDVDQHLSEIQSSGSFATFGILTDFVNPGLSLDSKHLIRLPLSSKDANWIIRASDQAPFGQGQKTLVDTSVRKTWQIDASNVTFLNPKFHTWLKSVAARVSRELAIADEDHVHAEFYKLLLYEEGGKFKVHKDTEKQPGMFGTMVVCLPSGHEGGDVVLHHGGKEKRLCTSEHSAFDASYLAWYSDVDHEVEEVRSGYRWVLTYNLINTGKSPASSAKWLKDRERSLAQLLNANNMMTTFRYLLVPLEHLYSVQSLKLDCMKGRDHHLVSHIISSWQGHGTLRVLLAHLERRKTGIFEDDEPTFEQPILTTITDISGQDLLILPRDVNEDKIVREIFQEDREPNEQRGGGYTGNYYAEATQIYKNSVVVLITGVDKFLCRGSQRCEDLGKLLWKLSRRDGIQSSQSEAKRTWLECWHSGFDDVSSHRNLLLDPLASTALIADETDLFNSVFEQMETGLTTESCERIGAAISPKSLAAAKSSLGSCMIGNHEIYESLRNLNAFTKGLTHENPHEEDAFEKENLSHWPADLVATVLSNASEAGAAEAIQLVEFLDLQRDPPPIDSIVNQSIGEFLNAFGNDVRFVTAFGLAALRDDTRSTSLQQYLSDLLLQKLELIVTFFDLETLVKVIEDQYSLALPFEKRMDCFKNLIQFVQQHRPELAGPFFDHIRPPLTETNILTAVNPLALITVIIEVGRPTDASSRACLATLLGVYTMMEIGEEPPPRPLSWTPSADIEDFWNGFPLIKTLVKFSNDWESEQLSLKGIESGKEEVEYCKGWFKSLRFEGPKHRPVAVKKTSIWKTNKLARWTKRYDRAVRDLKEHVSLERLQEFVPGLGAILRLDNLLSVIPVKDLMQGLFLEESNLSTASSALSYGA